jgi:hypothetical protein
MDRRQVLGLGAAAMAGKALYLGAAPMSAMTIPEIEAAIAAGRILPMVGSQTVMTISGSNVTAWGTGNGRSQAYNVAGVLYNRVQIFSAAGSVVDVTIDMRAAATISASSVSVAVPWYTVATLANPVTATGEYWAVPVGNYISVNAANYVNGTCYAILETHI